MITKHTKQITSTLRFGALLTLLPLGAFAGSWGVSGGGYWQVSVPSGATASSEAYVSGPGGVAMCTLYPDGGSPIYSISAHSSYPGIPDDEHASASISAGSYDVSQVASGSGSSATTDIVW